MEKNYIVTTTPRDEDAQGLEILSHESLYGAGFDFDQAFALRLSDNQVLLCDRVVRVLPRKRMVVFGRWHGRAIAAKLFFDPTSAKRHCDHEVIGVKSLQKNKIPTPDILFHGLTQDSKVYVLIFACIENASNLEDVFRTRQSLNECMSILEMVVIEIATQHVLGLLQKDLHLGNFLLRERVIYTLDGAQIETHAGLLPKNTSMANLALFLSQLGVNAGEQQKHLFEHYAQSRGWSLKSDDYEEMSYLIQQSNSKRWKSYAAKIVRDSSHFVRFDNKTSIVMVNRLFQDKELNTILNNPEQAFKHPSAKMLKAGGSSTVIKVTLDGRDYVVKRYNLKNTWHRLRRFFRATRAACAWRVAQKCYLFNVATAMPVAFIENRYLGLRGTSYYISQYITGEHAGNYFNRHFNRHDDINTMVVKITDLLKSVSNLDMTHGDLKITNILIDQNKQPVLIDFDGAREYTSLTRLKKAWHKDLLRFLANFQSNPVVLKQFILEFEKWP